MAHQGPTNTAYDASTVAGFKSWADNVQGTNSALAAIGWIQTSDGNQVNWSTITTPPYATSSYNNTVAANSATAGGPYFEYKINPRGTWVSGTTYSYLDLVYSDPGGGGTGDNFLLTRAPFSITNVAVSAGTATITCSNNLVAGEQVTITRILNATFLKNQTVTVLTATATSFTCTAPNGVTTYGSTADTGLGTIVINTATRPETDTKNYVVYHYEMWRTNDTAIYTITNVSRTAGGLATFTCNNRLAAGFVITVAGLTNVPALNGTWTVASATSTQFTVQTGGGVIGSTADSGTATYILWPIYMKLEYWANIVGGHPVPWIRVSFGTATDGLGNVAGNHIGSDQFGNNAQPYMPIELRTQNPSANWSLTLDKRCIWSGSASDFGACLWYMTSANVPQNCGAYWIVERGRDANGNNIDDYFHILAGVRYGTTPQFSTASSSSRSILKPNPIVNITYVSIDGSNNVTCTYSTTGTNVPGYQFAVGAIVYLSGFTNATFLNNQFATITAVTSTTFTFTLTHGAYSYPDAGVASQSISTSVYTPIAGTGFAQWPDIYIPTILTGLNSLTVNGNSPLLPIFPTPGYLGNPMTMAMSFRSSDTATQGTTTTITLYGTTHTYYFPTGNVAGGYTPWEEFGGTGTSSGNNNMALRWE